MFMRLQQSHMVSKMSTQGSNPIIVVALPLVVTFATCTICFTNEMAFCYFGYSTFNAFCVEISTMILQMIHSCLLLRFGTLEKNCELINGLRFFCVV